MSDEKDETTEEKNKYALSQEFIDEANKETMLNTYDLKSEGRTVLNKCQRYIEEYYKQKRFLNKVENLMKEKKCELFIHYKTKFEIKITSATDLNIMIEGDKHFLKLIKLQKEVENNLDFLEKTIKSLNNKAYMVGNMVTLNKIENAGN
jgi:hypothetical protein